MFMLARCLVGVHVSKVSRILKACTDKLMGVLSFATHHSREKLFENALVIIIIITKTKKIDKSKYLKFIQNWSSHRYKIGHLINIDIHI
jgi:hypothetical protein